MIKTSEVLQREVCKEESKYATNQHNSSLNVLSYKIVDVKIITKPPYTGSTAVIRNNYTHVSFTSHAKKDYEY